MAKRRAPLEYNKRWQMRLWLFGVFFFLYAPLIALIAFSFNDSKRTTVWRGFTFKYYDKLFHNEDLLIAFGNSLHGIRGSGFDSPTLERVCGRIDQKLVKIGANAAGG